MNPLPDAVETVPVTVISERGIKKRKDPVVHEYALSIVLNDTKLLTLVCSPEDPRSLAVGHLFTQGFISGVDEIGKIEVRVDNRAVSVYINRTEKAATETILPPGGIHPVSIPSGVIHLRKVGSDFPVSFQRITGLISRAEENCEIFERTGGAHACALSDTDGVFVFSEDIGRHNAIDRVIGRCLLDGVLFRDKLLFTTGRVSTAIVTKVVRAGIPLLVSRSAPSFEAVRLAAEYDVTLAGFAREGRMNVYAGEDRIV